MSSTTEDQTYNGWKNYPTWAVNLWLSNDEGLYNSTRELVRNVANDAQETEYWTGETFVNLPQSVRMKGQPQVEDSRRYNVADALKDFVEELASDAYSEASFVSDLLGYALSEVDWHEIADAWLEDYVNTSPH